MVCLPIPPLPHFAYKNIPENCFAANLDPPDSVSLRRILVSLLSLCILSNAGEGSAIDGRMRFYFSTRQFDLVFSRGRDHC